MADRIRVLELLVSTGLGGGPAHVRDLVAALPAGEFDVTILGPHDAPPGMLASVEAIDVATNSAPRLPGAAASIIAILRERGIQVIHTHGKGAALTGHWAAWRVGIPLVHTFHGIHYAHYPPGARAAYLRLERWLARRAHAVIHVSASQAAEAARLGLAPPGRTRVIVNGIDADRVRALAAAGRGRAAAGLPIGARVIGTVARLEPVKGVARLLDALAILAPRLPAAALLVVGDGPEAGPLRRRARALGLEGRVAWAGAVPEAARCLPAMEVFASASRREGLPLAPLEAMACGLPVVATRVPGHVDIVADGETGLLVAPDDPAALAAALEAVLADPARGRALGAAGRERVARHFSAARMAAETAAVYREAARGFPGGGPRGGVV